MSEGISKIPERVCLLCSRQFTGEVTLCPEHGDRVVAVQQNPLAGTGIEDRYEILSLIGFGATSLVYKARHKIMDRLAAIKILAAGNESESGRFQKESRTISLLNHPNVVNIYDSGVTPDGKSYLVMEYLEGKSLSEIINESGQISYGWALNVFCQVCIALEHAHLSGVVHLDVKPSNIVIIDSVSDQVQVKVVDFGISMLMSWAARGALESFEQGQAYGSPLYMSPEQFLNMDVDYRSDIYALGATMYEVLSGYRPFRANTIESLIGKKLTGLPAPIKTICPDLPIPDRLDAIVLKALQPEKKNRHQTISELKAELEQLRNGSTAGILGDDVQMGVMIVEDNPVARLGLHSDLNSIAGINIIAEAENGKEALDRLHEVTPSVVLMDIDMPEMNGIDATREIKRRYPGMHVIMFTVHDDVEAILSAFGAGADGYCIKGQDSAHLESAIRSVDNDGSWLDSEIATRVLRTCAHAPLTVQNEVSSVRVDEKEATYQSDHDYLLAMAGKCYRCKQYDESTALLNGAKALMEQVDSTIANETVELITSLADAYYQGGDQGMAESLYLKALDLRAQATRQESWVYGSGKELMFEAAYDGGEGEMAEAHKLFLWSLRQSAEFSALNDLKLSDETLSKLAWLYRAQKRFEEADALDQFFQGYQTE